MSKHISYNAKTNYYGNGASPISTRNALMTMRAVTPAVKPLAASEEN